MRATNAKSHKDLADNLVVAASILDRMKGLLGKQTMGAGEGVWLKPCMGIHTIGMKFPIDAVFLDKENTVVAINRNLQPNHMTTLHFDASSVLELPAGAADTTSTEVGDKLEFS
ncbi:MAG: DUF192 domain-containing protein [Geobacter sp.]|nr:DUF192 domain-containing protein [Geobacter sp.]